jgi:multidrug efflux pump subunit AcrA (membrane-fusion protein)
MGGGGGDFALVLQSAAAAGSRVKKGELIAEFDRLNMQNRLDDFRSALRDQAEGLKTLQTNLEVQKQAHLQSIGTAKAALDKAQLDLKTIPVQSDMQVERLKLAAEEAQASYKQLLNEIKQKEAAQAAELRIAKLEYDQSVVEFQRVEANVERMVARAPMDGIVVMGTTFRGSEFSQIQAGDQVQPGMMFMRVVDPSSMVINAAVNQVDVDSVRIGMKARVRFDAYPGLELPARVHSIAAIPKSGGSRPNWVKEIPVVLKLDAMDSRVIPDLSVSVDVLLDGSPNVTLAPVESIFRDSASGAPYVFVRGGSGWERRPVELGPANNVAAVILSGVQPGELVAAEYPIQNKGK